MYNIYTIRNDGRLIKVFKDFGSLRDYILNYGVANYDDCYSMMIWDIAKKANWVVNSIEVSEEVYSSLNV